MSMCALKGGEQNTVYTLSHLSNMVALRVALKSPYNFTTISPTLKGVHDLSCYHQELALD